MKTEALIHALTVDAATPAPPLRRLMGNALTLGIAGSLAVFAALLKPRADLVDAWSNPGFLVKVAVVLCLAITAASTLRKLASPLPQRATLRMLWLPVLLLVVGVVFELLTLPSASWAAGLFGRNASRCLVRIPLLSLAPAICLMFALRQGAPARPGLAGAIAGLAAGGLGACIYAMACPEDAPMFVVAWYSVAIAIVTGGCFMFGRRWLRW